MPTTIFPSSMSEFSTRPVVEFARIANISDPSHDELIVLPIPMSLQFNDSAAYGNASIGLGGTLLMNAAMSGSSNAAVGETRQSISDAVPKDMKSVAHLLSRNMLSGEYRAAAGVATQTILNKNVITEFTGVSTRQFGFQFKLVATSKAESDAIRNMINIFRDGLYPEATQLQVKYPNTWRIRFKQNKKSIEYIPKIFETYLTTMSTTYNGSTNMFHEDGAPVEVDLTLNFIETRALCKGDIVALKDREFISSDFRWVVAKQIVDSTASTPTTTSNQTQNNGI